jgi:hypothetical protein
MNINGEKPNNFGCCLFYDKQIEERRSAIEHQAVVKPPAKALHQEAVFETENHNCLTGRKLKKYFEFVKILRIKVKKINKRLTKKAATKSIPGRLYIEDKTGMIL